MSFDPLEFARGLSFEDDDLDDFKALIRYEGLDVKVTLETLHGYYRASGREDFKKDVIKMCLVYASRGTKVSKLCNNENFRQTFEEIAKAYEIKSSVTKNDPKCITLGRVAAANALVVCEILHKKLGNVVSGIHINYPEFPRAMSTPVFSSLIPGGDSMDGVDRGLLIEAHLIHNKYFDEVINGGNGLSDLRYYQKAGTDGDLYDADTRVRALETFGILVGGKLKENIRNLFIDMIAREGRVPL